MTGQRQCSEGVALSQEETVALLENQLAAARAGEAKAKHYEYQLIALQHSDLQQQDRCDQLQNFANVALLKLEKMQSQLAMGSPSDEECGPSYPELSDSGMQLRCLELRLMLQQGQLDSLRASRDHLLAMRSEQSGGMMAEVNLQSLLQYAQGLETLLDTCTPGMGATMPCRRSAKVANVDAEHYPDFLYGSRSADKQLQPQLSKSHLRKHSGSDAISDVSTSVGSSSVRSAAEDPSLAAFLTMPEKDKGLKEKKKVAKHVRFRPPLRMNRERSTSPSCSSKELRRALRARSGSRRRSSSKEQARPEQETKEWSDNAWSLQDFTDWVS